MFNDKFVELIKINNVLNRLKINRNFRQTVSELYQFNTHIISLIPPSLIPPKNPYYDIFNCNILLMKLRPDLIIQLKY